MTKLSAILNIPGDNTLLSPRAKSEGFNNIVGGYPSRIIAANRAMYNGATTNCCRWISTSGTVRFTNVALTSIVANSTVAYPYANNTGTSEKITAYDSTAKTITTSSGTYTQDEATFGTGLGTIKTGITDIIIGPIADVIYNDVENVTTDTTSKSDEWGLKAVTISESNIGDTIAVAGASTTTNPTLTLLTSDNIATYTGTEQLVCRFKVGGKIFVTTNSSNEDLIVERTIKTVEYNYSSGQLQNIWIEFTEAILFDPSSTTFTPERVDLKFKGSSLSEYTSLAVTNALRYFRIYTATASSLGTVGGWKPTITKDGESFTAFSYSWSYKYGAGKPSGEDTLTITFSASQTAYPNAEFRLTGPAGLDGQPAVAIIENSYFDYTADSFGEYNASVGANVHTTGNWNINTGDFTEMSGIGNINVGVLSDIGGATNVCHSGSGNFIRGTNNFVTGRDSYAFGGRNRSYFDSNLTVGGMNEAWAGNNALVGFGNKSYGSSNVGFGAQVTFKPTSNNSVGLGRNLTIYAKEACVIGYNGELPEYEGTLAADNVAYNSGDIEGIHYKGAVALAAGLGNGSASNKTNIPLIFTKYKWRKNPAYPWGSTSNRYKERTTTTADRMLLENYDLLTINANLRVNGTITDNSTKNLDLTQASYFAWVDGNGNIRYTNTTTIVQGTTVAYKDSACTTPATVTFTWKSEKWTSTSNDVCYTKNINPLVGELVYENEDCSGEGVAITAVTKTTAATTAITAGGVTYTTKAATTTSRTETRNVVFSAFTKWVSESAQTIWYTKTASPAAGDIAYSTAACSGTGTAITEVGTNTIKVSKVDHTRAQSVSSEAPVNYLLEDAASETAVRTEFTRSAINDVYDATYVMYTSGQDIPFVVQLNGKKAGRYKVVCGTSNTTVTPISGSYNEFDKFELAIVNGGTIFSFPSDWVNLDSTTSLQSTGIDLFEVRYVASKFFYKRILSYATANA